MGFQEATFLTASSGQDGDMWDRSLTTQPTLTTVTLVHTVKSNIHNTCATESTKETALSCNFCYVQNLTLLSAASVWYGFTDGG